MFTKNDLKELGDKERKRATSFLETYVDYIKWTTVLNLAAVAWVAATLSEGPRISQTLSGFSLVSLALAAIFAVASLKIVMDGAANEWQATRVNRSLALLDLFEKAGADEPFVQRKKNELAEQFKKEFEAGEKFSGPTFYTRFALVHVVALCLGIILYAISKFTALICVG